MRMPEALTERGKSGLYVSYFYICATDVYPLNWADVRLYISVCAPDKRWRRRRHESIPPFSASLFITSVPLWPTSSSHSPPYLHSTPTFPSISLHPITLTTLSITALLLLWKKKEKRGSFEETDLILCHNNKNTYEAVNLTENRVTKSCCDPVLKGSGLH